MRNTAPRPFEIDGASALLVQRSTSVYFAEHKFDRCQTCFCLIRAASVPLLKVLNVAEPPRMAVMQIRNVFRRKTKHAAQECIGRTFLGVPAVNLCLRLVSAERTRMSVDPAAAMFLQRKNSRPEVYTDVHFWTGYFQKAYGDDFLKNR